MIIDIALPVALAWLGSLFAYSGSLKLIQPAALRIRVIEGYDVLPASAARLVGTLLPHVELAVGALILLTPYGRIGAVAAGALGAAFAIGASAVLARSIHTECGCAGVASGQVRPATLARALLMMFAASAVAIAGSPIPSLVGWPILAAALIPACLTLRRTFVARQSTSPIRSGVSR